MMYSYQGDLRGVQTSQCTRSHGAQTAVGFVEVDIQAIQLQVISMADSLMVNTVLVTNYLRRTLDVTT